MNSSADEGNKSLCTEWSLSTHGTIHILELGRLISMGNGLLLARSLVELQGFLGLALQIHEHVGLAIQGSIVIQLMEGPAFLYARLTCCWFVHYLNVDTRMSFSSKSQLVLIRAIFKLKEFWDRQHFAITF